MCYNLLTSEVLVVVVVGVDDDVDGLDEWNCHLSEFVVLAESVDAFDSNFAYELDLNNVHWIVAVAVEVFDECDVVADAQRENVFDEYLSDASLIDV